MNWHEAMSASGERPAVHPDCRRPIKISYIGSLSLSLSLSSKNPLPSFIAKLFLLSDKRRELLAR